MFDGWTRELFEILDETLRTHTLARKQSEMGKDIRSRDIYFGFNLLSEELMRTSNSVRYVSEFLSYDEEINSQLGAVPGMSCCPDKKNKRGFKIFSCNGCNHMDIDDKCVKGYYFYLVVFLPGEI